MIKTAIRIIIHVTTNEREEIYATKTSINRSL